MKQFSYQNRKDRISMRADITGLVTHLTKPTLYVLKGTRTVLRREGGSNSSVLADSSQKLGMKQLSRIM